MMSAIEDRDGPRAIRATRAPGSPLAQILALYAPPVPVVVDPPANAPVPVEEAPQPRQATDQTSAPTWNQTEANRLLTHLRDAWNHAHAGEEQALRLQDQDIRNGPRRRENVPGAALPAREAPEARKSTRRRPARRRPARRPAVALDRTRASGLERRARAGDHRRQRRREREQVKARPDHGSMHQLCSDRVSSWACFA